MNPVFNFRQQLRHDLSFNSFEVEGLLLVEYNCPLDAEYVKIWSESDYVIYVLSGKKTWKTIDESWEANAGDILYIKKGANIIRQSFNDDFCMIGFFISDNVIRKTVESIKGEIPLIQKTKEPPGNVTKLNTIQSLETYYQSILVYFKHSKAPLPNILELKAQELILNIINSGSYSDLSHYFYQISRNHKPSLAQIMESNFHFHLEIKEYAEMTNRSLSTFKRDFKYHFNTTPGKWLLEKRLEMAASLLVSSPSTVSEIAYESGFIDLSHFSKSFRERFGKSPRDFRRQPF